MEINKISASAYKNWEKCEFSYFISYILKLTGNPNWGASQGSVVHEVIEAYLKGNKLWKRAVPALYRKYEPWKWRKVKDKETGKKVFEHPLQKTCKSCPLYSNGKCRAVNLDVKKIKGCPKNAYEETINMLEYIFETRGHYFERKILGIEDDFEIELDNGIKIMGFIDLVTELDEETIEIVDWKTGTWTQNYNEAIEDIQLRIYDLAVREKYPQYKHIVCTLDYIQGKPVTVAFELDDVEETKRRIRKVWHDVAICKKAERTVSQEWKCNSICIGKENCDKLFADYEKGLSVDELVQSMAGVLNSRKRK